MKTITLLLILSYATLMAKDYTVKLFDNNISNGIWQMVGVTGLKDVSSGVISQDSSQPNSTTEPIIPDEDTGITNTTPATSNSAGVYDESGFSELEIDIVKTFDTNLSNTSFNPIHSSIGELSVYRYNGIANNDIWSYFHSKNSSDGNDFFKFEKGKGYWAKYEDKKLESDSNMTYVSNAGFIFDDSFKFGITSYADKINAGWNLLSLPEKRTIEVIYAIILHYNENREYNLTISKKDDLDKLQINLDNNSTLEAVKEINSKSTMLDIFALESDNSNILLLSRSEFIISDENDIMTSSIPDIEVLSTTQRKESSYIYGFMLDLNKTFVSKFSTPLNLNLNGENIDILTTNLESSKKDIRSLKIIGTDKNLTMLFSQKTFYLENPNYIKRYHFDMTKNVPSGFFSIDGNKTIFQLAKNRTDFNKSMKIVQNSRDYEIIKGYGNLADICTKLSLTNHITQIPALAQAPLYLKTYAFPKTDNLVYFLSNIFDGYKPNQILTLKTNPTNSGDWDSMPISNNLTDWTSFSSKYDRTFSTDKRKSYWIKFAQVSSSTSAEFQIDEEQTSISRYVTQQLSVEDNSTIVNNIHYDVQIFLKNVSKAVRGYIQIDNLEIDLKPELDGTVLSAEIDYESLYSISNINLVSEVTVVVVDEKGIEKRTQLAIDFTKPSAPSPTIKLTDIINNSYYRIYQENVSTFKTVTSLYPDLCQDLGIAQIYVVKTDNNDTTLDRSKLILSDAIKITYASLYKGTSKLMSSTIKDVNKPIKYNELCEKISETPAKTESIILGKSMEDLQLFYKNVVDVISTELSPPKIMYVSINGNIMKIAFDINYANHEFFILDSSDNILTGKFTADLYSNNQNPLSISQVE